jgi:hypothetical protein
MVIELDVSLEHESATLRWIVISRAFEQLAIGIASLTSSLANRRAAILAAPFAGHAHVAGLG